MHSTHSDTVCVPGTASLCATDSDLLPLVSICVKRAVAKVHTADQFKTTVGISTINDQKAIQWGKMAIGFMTVHLL